MTLRRLPRVGPEAIELLDAGVGTADEEAEAYRLLEVVNERLGGYRATSRALATFRALAALPNGDRERRIVFVDIAGATARSRSA